MCSHDEHLLYAREGGSIVCTTTHYYKEKILIAGRSNELTLGLIDLRLWIIHNLKLCVQVICNGLFRAVLVWERVSEEV